jgi:hypothetical protein
MNESKNVKALKKQLAAAIAMVCVAAVALGSSTYAWFVNNNTVKATTSTISAQSNAAFMYIRDEKEQSKNLTADTSSVTSTALYPAHWVTAKAGNYATADIGKFYTAYGTTAEDGTMAAKTLKIVEKNADSATKGSPADAVAAQYAVKNTFFIGSKGTELSDLLFFVFLFYLFDIIGIVVFIFFPLHSTLLTAYIFSLHKLHILAFLLFHLYLQILTEYL